MLTLELSYALRHHSLRLSRLPNEICLRYVKFSKRSLPSLILKQTKRLIFQRDVRAVLPGHVALSRMFSCSMFDREPMTI